MTSRTGIAAILAGALYFVGQGGQLVTGDDVDGVHVGYVYVGFVIAGFVALAVALWGLRALIAGTRLGRIGIRLALAGGAFLALFSIHVVVELIRTGDIPDNFILFLIGFLLILLGQLLFARDLRPSLGRAWVLPIVAVGRVWPSRLGDEHSPGLSLKRRGNALVCQAYSIVSPGERYVSAMSML